MTKERRDQIVRLKTVPTVLGLWTLLVAALGLFHQWRFEHWMRLEWPKGLLVLPFWLLSVDIALIAGGFGLLKVRSVRSPTPTGRYWASVYVGFISVAAMALLLWDVLRHMFAGSGYTT